MGPSQQTFSHNFGEGLIGKPLKSGGGGFTSSNQPIPSQPQLPEGRTPSPSKRSARIPLSQLFRTPIYLRTQNTPSKLSTSSTDTPSTSPDTSNLTDNSNSSNLSNDSSLPPPSQTETSSTPNLATPTTNSDILNNSLLYTPSSPAYDIQGVKTLLKKKNDQITKSANEIKKLQFHLNEARKKHAVLEEDLKEKQHSLAV